MSEELVKKWLLFACGDKEIEDIVLEGIRQIPVRIALLQRYLKAQDINGLRETIHSLKGTFGNLHIKEIAEPAEKMYAEALLPQPDMVKLGAFIDIMQQIAAQIPQHFLVTPGQDGTTTPDKGTNNALLLVADDEELNRKILANLCSDVLEIECDTAADGKQALELIKANHYKLILLDVHMPGMSGIEVVNELRTMEHYRKVPVIAISGSGSASENIDLIAEGFSECWPKPFDLFALGKRIAELLDI